ncbi:MAG: B12-binding domain-containing radical SAM protein [Verrucomicrobiae bacterium]|nr:B12-binding domain-containing radical SAM protein [Verrucomicrobiae bacterium]
MTDVLLVQPPTSFTNPAANFNYDWVGAIGMAYLLAILRRAGIRCRAISNHRAQMSVDELLNLCEREKVKILGISAFTAQIRSAVILAGAAKKRFGDKIHVALGGVHVGVDPDIVRRYACFDTGVVGECEDYIVEFVSRVLGGEKLSGVFYAKSPQNLDAIPFPDYAAVELNGFDYKKMVEILATRGCPHRCGYCCSPFLKEKVRGRSPENVVAEMKERWRHGTREMFFTDDAATINKKRVIKMCELMVREGLRMKFHMITRVDYLDEDVVRALKMAGCRSLMLGIESGNERIRNESIGKRLSDEAIFTGMALLKKYNIHVDLFFMIGHPGETEDDIRDSIEFPYRLERAGLTNIQQAGYHLSIPFPGTDYFKWCVAKGQFGPNLVDEYIAGKLGDGFMGNWPFLIPEGLTLEKMLYYRDLAHRRFYLRPRYIARRFLYHLSEPKKLREDFQNAMSILFRGTSAREVTYKAPKEKRG